MDKIPAATLEALNDGPKVVRGNNHNIVVFADAGQCYAVDNRCPHMGFPLDRGTVKDGILTCHWHQARFDLSSGCTFDLWADDVLKFTTWVDDGQVFVSADPEAQRDVEFYRRRLIQGVEQNVPLVQAKSLLSILQSSTDLSLLLNDVVGYAVDNLDVMSEGLTRLGCVVNLYPNLSPDVAYQGLFYAIRKIAEETARSIRHRRKDALSGEDYDYTQLKAWLHQWVQTRHTDGTERTLLTGLRLPDSEQADLVYSAASKRLYADGGHLLESCNKAFEFGKHCPAYKSAIFPLLVDPLTQSMGREESTNWHHPIDIIQPLNEVDLKLPSVMANNQGKGQIDESMQDVFLGDDPLLIIDRLLQALIDDVSPELLARELCYAAAMRLARFATSNEVTDWFNPQHTFIFCHAAYRAIRQSPTPEVVRTMFQGAISVYMDRFLNVPAAPLPSERKLADQPETADELLEKLLEQLDQRANINDTAAVTATYVARGFPVKDLVNTLTLATVREDLDFHSLQVLDAAVQQCAGWDDQQVVENIMVGVTRNLAAHCPTRRAGQQTARIAAKLQRGEAIYE